MKIGIVAGEHSGDVLGAGLITELREKGTLSAIGVAGPEMLNAGCETLYEMESLTHMGIIEPLFHLPQLISIRRGLLNYFLKNPPDVFVGIDSPDFNLGLELKLRQAQIPIVHYVSPSVWAWRQNRIIKIEKAVDLMLTLFPFETEFYLRHQVPVHFVGHPLADKIPLQPDKAAARRRLNLDGDKIYIGILPGSRRNELKYLAEVFIACAFRCWKLRPNIEFITAAANRTRNQEFQHLWRKHVPQIPIKFYEGSAHDVMEAADVMMVTSGTATLETMLYKCPMVIAYRMGALTYQIARHLVKLPFIGLPNLLANELIVPEFLQKEATPEKMTLALLNLLDHPEKVKELQKKFLAIHLQLRCNANQQAAQAIQELIKKQVK